MKYTLGFAFSKNKEKMILIRKGRKKGLEWMDGMYNGVGGKIDRMAEKSPIAYEGLEIPIDAMRREFEEETGVLLKNWELFAHINHQNENEVYCFRIFDDEIENCITKEDEKVCIFDADEVKYNQHIPLIWNLYTLIPMALDENFEFCEINMK